MLVARNVDAMDQPTSTLLTGPLDVATRQWTAGIVNGEGDTSYVIANAARLTFNASGTRFDGEGLSAQTAGPEAWQGGRMDGSFVCGP